MKPSEILFKILLSFILFFVFGSIILYPKDMYYLTKINTEPGIESRFEIIGHFYFTDEREATIYKDKETDIEYFYVWDGPANGGPTITRLWKRGE